MAYTRPDIYYTKPIPAPSAMVSDALHTDAVIGNAIQWITGIKKAGIVRACTVS